MTNFIQYAEHIVAESSGLLGTTGGEHILHFLAESDIENGSVVALGDFVDGEVWKAKTPAVGDDIFLILSEEKTDEIPGLPMTKEVRYFYNGNGEIMRGYHLGKYDKFAISPSGVDGGEKGKFVTVDGKTKKLTAVATAPTENAFVGYIYDIASNGNLRIIVKKNG